jgi:hypothetical protein
MHAAVSVYLNNLERLPWLIEGSLGPSSHEQLCTGDCLNVDEARTLVALVLFTNWGVKL